MMSESERIKLKECLPRGWGEIIAQRAGTSRQTVYDVISGRRNNTKVELEALKLAKESLVENEEKNNLKKEILS